MSNYAAVKSDMRPTESVCERNDTVDIGIVTASVVAVEPICPIARLVDLDEVIALEMDGGACQTSFWPFMLMKLTSAHMAHISPRRNKLRKTIGFICRSTLLRFEGVPPEFITILVSLPLMATTPITQSVLRTTVPRKSIVLRVTGAFKGRPSLPRRPSWKTIAASKVNMLTDGASASIVNFACSRSDEVRYSVSSGTACRDLRFVSPSRFFVST